MEGAPGWIVTILQNYGLAGVVIFVLAFICYALWKSLSEVNSARLGERDVLIKTIESNTNAARENTKATEERNNATRALADAINKQAGAFEMFIQKAELQHENLKDGYRDIKLVVDALAESNRTNTGILRDLQRAVEK